MPRHLRVLAATALVNVLLAADSAPADIQPWVQDLGGSVRHGPDGEVVGIDLSRSWVSDVDLQRLAGMGSLASLALAQTHVSDSALEIVATLPQLRELDLFFCEHITDAGASHLRGAAGLERLNIRGTKISDSGVKFLTELQRLESLDIGITEIGDPSIELLESLPNLQTLAIGGNRIGEVGVASLRSLKRLRELDLSGAQVTDSGIWAVTITDLNLDDVGVLAGLEALNLAAPSQEYVAAVSSGVPRLRGAIRVTDFGAVQLARLTKLRSLNVSRSALTAEGIRGLQGLNLIEELVLSHISSIDDEAGRALAGLASLKVLDVSFTRFGDAGLLALKHHPNIRRIVAAGTPLGADAVAEYLAAQPGRELIR